MSQQVQAIYENGLLRPLTPLDLPENKIVNVVILRVLKNDAKFEADVDEESSETKVIDSKQPED